MREHCARWRGTFDIHPATFSLFGVETLLVETHRRREEHRSCSTKLQQMMNEFQLGQEAWLSRRTSSPDAARCGNLPTSFERVRRKRVARVAISDYYRCPAITIAVQRLQSLSSDYYRCDRRSETAITIADVVNPDPTPRR